MAEERTIRERDASAVPSRSPRLRTVGDRSRRPGQGALPEVPRHRQHGSVRAAPGRSQPEAATLRSTTV